MEINRYRFKGDKISVEKSIKELIDKEIQYIIESEVNYGSNDEMVDIVILIKDNTKHELKKVDCSICDNLNTKWCGGCEYGRVCGDNFDFYRPNMKKELIS